MIGGIITAGVIAAAAVVAVLSGRWRCALIPFRIRPSSLTVERLGLQVDGGRDTERVDSVLSAFAGGFNAMLTAPNERAWRSFCASQPPLFRPFAEEGVAMGYIPRHLFRYDSGAFERHLVKTAPEFRYLYYVGLGFWAGMRDYDDARLARLVRDLDPLHRYLCFDGYGFQRAFFHHVADRDALRRLDTLPGYFRNAAYQGVGRAFYFRFMAELDVLIDNIGLLGEHASDAAAGVGLAAAFVNPDRLEVAQGLAAQFPPEWHDAVHLGICFGMKARSINDVDGFERYMARTEQSVRESVLASIRECDRVELLVRADRGPDAYRRWRERVAAWMRGHIAYPVAGMRKTATTALDAASPANTSIRGAW